MLKFAPWNPPSLDYGFFLYVAALPQSRIRIRHSYGSANVRLGNLFSLTRSRFGLAHFDILTTFLYSQPHRSAPCNFNSTTFRHQLTCGANSNIPRIRLTKPN
ncbi:hypothetical protein BDZ89DRAFT_393748 [Hymenopellis radicata]|nr:hypothetical protein BDZ89DRAFT_393748 [Hymenopellis radicata]